MSKIRTRLPTLDPHFEAVAERDEAVAERDEAVAKRDAERARADAAEARANRFEELLKQKVGDSECVE